MEKLKSEKIINKNTDKKSDEEKVEKSNIDNNNNNKIENEENNKKEGVFSTEFTEKIELTEEERKLRQNYLKKVTTKETIIRSIFLGKKQLLFKLYSFIMGIISNILRIQETKYKSNAVNAITSKDLDKFIYSVKYLIITTISTLTIEFIGDFVYKKLTQGSGSRNIMLKNFLYKKDIVFFDLFKTGELSNKVQTFSE